MISTCTRVEGHELTEPWALRLSEALVSATMVEDIALRFYLPCSGLPSAFALSKSEKILVGLSC